MENYLFFNVLKSLFWCYISKHWNTSLFCIVTDNEPENLLYLAPTAGEECVPLGFPTFSQGMQIHKKKGM